GRITKDHIAEARPSLLHLKRDLATPDAGVTLEGDGGEVLARRVRAGLELPDQPCRGFHRAFQFNPVRHGTVGACRSFTSLPTAVTFAGRAPDHLDGATQRRPNEMCAEAQDGGLSRQIRALSPGHVRLLCRRTMNHLPVAHHTSRPHLCQPFPTTAPIAFP